jgi:hypothetical protein
MFAVIALWCDQEKRLKKQDPNGIVSAQSNQTPIE